MSTDESGLPFINRIENRDIKNSCIKQGILREGDQDHLAFPKMVLTNNICAVIVKVLK